MGLLDGGIASVFGSAFGALYLDGAIISDQTIPIYDADGNITGYAGGAEVPCKVQVDAATYAMRRAEGFSEGDVRLIVLTAGVDVALTTDHRIVVHGKTWLIASVEVDPAGSHWICRGRAA